MKKLRSHLFSPIIDHFWTLHTLLDPLKVDNQSVQKLNHFNSQFIFPLIVSWAIPLVGVFVFEWEQTGRIDLTTLPNVVKSVLQTTRFYNVD